MVLSLSILKKSFEDFLSARMLLVNLGPILLSLAFFGIIFLLQWRKYGELLPDLITAIFE